MEAYLDYEQFCWNVVVQESTEVVIVWAVRMRLLWATPILNQVRQVLLAPCFHPASVPAALLSDFVMDCKFMLSS